MIPSMLLPAPTDYGPPPPAVPTSDVEQGGRGHDKTVKIVLEVIFIATAVFALLLCLLLRLLCLRRAQRPLKDFLTPLPPAPARPRHAHDPSPPPSRSTSRSEQMRQTIFLPTLPISAPQHPPATYPAPGVPALAHPRSHGDGRAGIAAHLAGLPRWPSVGARPPARRVDTLPLYDAKDAPPRYEDAVLPSPGASEAAASSPQALEGLETDLGRSAGR